MLTIKIANSTWDSIGSIATENCVLSNRLPDRRLYVLEIMTDANGESVMLVPHDDVNQSWLVYSPSTGIKRPHYLTDDDWKTVCEIGHLYGHGGTQRPKPIFKTQLRLIKGGKT